MTGHPVACVMDPPQLLDVDVDQLAGALPLVAVGHLGDLGGGHPKASQGLDRLEPVDPTSPSLASGRTHLAAVRSLTPAASAADLSDQAPSRRSTSRRLLFGPDEQRSEEQHLVVGVHDGLALADRLLEVGYESLE